MFCPGYALAGDMPVPDLVVQWVARQVQSDAAARPQYGIRDETRREHFQELRAYLGLSAFGLPEFRTLAHSVADLVMQTDKGLVLAAHALETLRQRHIILPILAVIERVCAEAVTRANRRIYRALLEQRQPHHKRGLDNLLNVAPDTNITWLMWLRQSPLKPNSRHMRKQIERLNIFQSLALPDGIGPQIHQNRFLKMAREGAQMQPFDLAKFEDERRYATLVALAIEGMGAASAQLRPPVDAIRHHVLAVTKLHPDDKPVPVLASGNGKIKNGRLRTYVRDERLVGATAPPAVWFACSPVHKGIHPQTQQAKFDDILHADGYAGFNALFE